MKIMKFAISVISIFGVTSVFADQCPDYLPFNLLSDCIVETVAIDGDYNAEEKYAEWQKILTEKLDALDDNIGTTITSAENN